MERDDEAVSCDQCDQYRSIDALHHVLHHSPGPRQRQYGGGGLRQGNSIFRIRKSASCSRLSRIRICFSRSSADGSATVSALERTLLACGAVWGIATLLTGFAGGLISLLAARVLLGFGEGATFPRGDIRDGALGRERKTRFRAGHHACGVARRQCGRARHRRTRDGELGMARIVLHLRCVQSVVGRRVGFDVHRASERPSAYHEGRTRTCCPRRKQSRRACPGRQLFRRMAPVTIVYFCYGWTLWLFLSWIPQYFLHSYHLELKKSAIFASAVFSRGCGRRHARRHRDRPHLCAHGEPEARA